MKFKRKVPCDTCPFRVDGNALRYLGESRAEEIAGALTSDQTFTCHGDIDEPSNEQNHCAGALLMLEKQENPNQMMRIAERLGFYSRLELKGHDEVFDDFRDWVDVQSEER